MGLINPVYKLEILDKTLNAITVVQDFWQLDNSGNYLEYNQKLSDYGMAKFRVSTLDPLFVNTGDIFQPYSNHVRIWRGPQIVFQGVIVEVPHRTRYFVEVEAFEYEYLLNKILIPNTTTAPAGGGATVSATGGANTFLVYNSGTMAQGVIQTIAWAKQAADAQSIIQQFTVGNIQNPLFPTGYTDLNGNDISGQQWDFSKLPLQFSYNDAFYVLTAFASYGVCDFQLAYTNPTTATPGLQFNFAKFLGKAQPSLVLSYNTNLSDIEDFDLPLHGKNMANSLVGIAADFNTANANLTMLQTTQEQPDSVTTYGRLQASAAFNDAKNLSYLKTRLSEELFAVAYPDMQMDFTMNLQSPYLGEFGVGDIVTVNINDRFLKFNQPRRIVMIDTRVHSTGKETIRVVTNRPRPGQV